MIIMIIIMPDFSQILR